MENIKSQLDKGCISKSTCVWTTGSSLEWHSVWDGQVQFVTSNRSIKSTVVLGSLLVGQVPEWQSIAWGIRHRDTCRRVRIFDSFHGLHLRHWFVTGQIKHFALSSISQAYFRICFATEPNCSHWIQANLMRFPFSIMCLIRRIVFTSDLFTSRATFFDFFSAFRLHD